MPDESSIMPASLFKLDTLYCADSVEFSPEIHSADILLCGTYQLLQPGSSTGNAGDEVETKRIGRCYVYKADLESGQLTEIQQFDLPAILDMKWSFSSYEGGPRVAIADSEGKISTYRWSETEDKLTLLQALHVSESTTLCLSLDWSGRRRQNHASSESLVTSCSNGSIYVLSHSPSGELEITNTWNAHDYEPWIAAWDYWSSNIVYSGGDDCRMKGWDIRLDGSRPIFDNKRFEAGVTSIQNHPLVEHVLAVGSYDSMVRIFDTRKPLVPVKQLDVGGGVWRVKWHPSPDRNCDLLAACMHDGFKVINFGEGVVKPETSPVITHRFDDHGSLAYGADWSYSQASDTLIASCSFYDHLLHTWRA